MSIKLSMIEEFMKSLTMLAVAVVTLIGTLSFACSPYEAQFIGKVTVINKAVGSDGSAQCSVQVGEFRFYQESMVCPLDQSIAQSLVIPARSCDLQVGEEVSGILSVDDAGNVKW